MHHYCIVASVGIMPSINRRLGSEDHVQRPLSKAAPLAGGPLVLMLWLIKRRRAIAFRNVRFAPRNGHSDYLKITAIRAIGL